MRAKKRFLALIPLVFLAMVAGTIMGGENPEGERTQRVPERRIVPKPAPTSLHGEHIPANCPNDPNRNVPGTLCEDFDTDRNGIPGFQWSRLPTGIHPFDPLLAIGDPNDDIFGFTLDGTAIPLGTGAVTCADDITFPNCQAPVTEENDWHLHSPLEGPGDGYDPPMRPGIGAPDGGKAHSGLRSMHMGRHTSASHTVGDVVRFRQVSAFVLDSQGDADLPGIVPGPGTTLEFWHMISIYDDENFGDGFLAPGESFGGGQVQISLLESSGNFSRWRRLDPTFNGYDSVDQLGVSTCAFDPTDDEAPPSDESFCDAVDGPGLWADIGDTYGTDPTCTTDTDGNDPYHLDCGDIQSCSGGPGCTETGSLGDGVWARSEFDLSPFAGRVARLRWIGMVEGGWSFGTSRSQNEPNGGGPAISYYDADTGWWIDDITLTDLRSAPVPCTTDGDGDGVDFCTPDCNDSEGSAWAAPGEASNLTLSGGPSATLDWAIPVDPGGSVVGYDLLRATSPGDFAGAGAICLEAGDTDTVATDSEIPTDVFYYLIRARNDCPAMGPAGTDSAGKSRAVRTCP